MHRIIYVILIRTTIKQENQEKDLEIIIFCTNVRDESTSRAIFWSNVLCKRVKREIVEN